jgi:predicted ATPase
MHFKCAIVGSPCSGKTFLTTELKRLGYQVMEERSTAIIKRELSLGHEHPTKYRDQFQREILEQQVYLEGRLDKRRDSFIERSLLDGLIYYRFDNLSIPQDLLEMVTGVSYDVIFFLDKVPVYQKTVVRTESPAEAERLRSLSEEILAEFGFQNKIIRVPFLGEVEKRVEFVTQTLDEKRSQLAMINKTKEKVQDL